ncbi:MAG: Sua5/YciO/YrdC/YwlC family protein [Chloroflexota bacterium]
MRTEVKSIVETQNLSRVAELLAAGELIVVFFQGTFAFLCDCDASEPAEKIFQTKNRPREKGLSLVVDPDCLQDFVDLDHPALRRFPLDKAQKLQRIPHALGIVFPAGPYAPKDLVQNGTIMNVWTEYPPSRPLSQLTQLALAKGLRGFKGASTNLSNEPTYSTVQQVLDQFNGIVPLILNGEVAVPEHRRKSTTLIDFTQQRPTMIRSGNVTAEEVQDALDEVGFGQLQISESVKVL